MARCSAHCSWSASRRAVLAAVIAAVVAACSGPTDAERIDSSLDATLRSAVGPWQGTASTTLTLDFTLAAASGTQLSGSGTMKEGTAAAVPITVTGSYSRPNLTLTFDGTTYAGHQVRGTFAGQYTTVGGIAAPLHLVSPDGYVKDLDVLLQER